MYKKCVSFYDVIWLTAIKMRLRMKSRSQRYSINIPRPTTHGYKYNKYKICLNMMIVICLSNT